MGGAVVTAVAEYRDGQANCLIAVEEWLGIKQYGICDVLISDKRIVVPLLLHSEV